MTKLLLDEHYAPLIARSLREQGHDCLAVAELPELTGRSDSALFVWAASAGRRIVTENVRDFRPLQSLVKRLGCGQSCWRACGRGGAPGD
ncbi:MAG: DUF5615 family PIN-like protein [Bifidobacteriaceae bacterium]|nr:DUF5615 family PIN-like protein [Bifidobacteriaceae bacterium]